MFVNFSQIIKVIVMTIKGQSDEKVSNAKLLE